MNSKQRLTWNQRGRLWLRLAIRVIIAIIVCWLMLNFGGQMLKLFAPFILALVVAMILNPLIDKIQSKINIKRNILTIILIVLASILCGIALYFIIKSLAVELIQLATSWDTLIKNMTDTIDNIEVGIQEIFKKMHINIELPDGTLMDTVVLQMLQSTKSIILDINNLAEFAKQRVSGLTLLFVSTLVFIMASYFITIDYHNISKKFSSTLGTDLSHVLNQVKSIFIAAFGGYIRARIIVAFGVGLIEFIGFIIIGQDYALILALIMVILDFIPIIGSGTVIVPWAIICMLIGNISYGIKLFVIYGIISVYRNIAEPKVVGTKTGLPAILSLITIYVGMKVAGVAGMILGPVITMTVINTLKIGVFSNTISDIKAAIYDISTILNTPIEEELSDKNNRANMYFGYLKHDTEDTTKGTIGETEGIKEDNKEVEN